MNIIINENTFKCRLCATPKTIREGMQNKTFDMHFNGMFFMLPNNGDQSFWMYDCITPLDIIFIDGDTITSIHSDCPPCHDETSCESYAGVGDQVLEVAGGTCDSLNIKVGDIVKTSLY